jgi:hypothetical protein
MAQTFINAHSSDATTTSGGNFPQEFTFHGTVHVTIDSGSTTGTTPVTGTTPTVPASTAPASQQLTNGAAITLDSGADVARVSAANPVTGVTLPDGTKDAQTITLLNYGPASVTLTDGTSVAANQYQSFQWSAASSSWSKA